MDDKISIVVPIYNVEKYLDDCIESLLKQSYKNLEIILIDDGSTDNSLSICNTYKSKDKRIKVVHKKNGGLSDARNVGIKLVTGKYITFVDSDDWLDKDFIKTLLEVMINEKADIVISGLITTKKRQFTYKNTTKSIEIVDKETAYKNVFLQDKFDVSACGKLYDKSFFANIKYPKGELYEDFQVIDKIFEKATKIAYTTYKGYYYYMREGSIMHGEFSTKRMALIDKAKNLIELTNNKYPSIMNAAKRRYIYSNFVILGFSILSKEHDEYSKKIRKNILNNAKEIYKGDCYTVKDKIATVFIFLGLKPYRFFWKLYKKMR